MAITMTEDWVREVDALATADFANVNAELNQRRLAAEPVPPAVRERFKVSALLGEMRSDLPLVHAARSMAHRDASWHLENTNRSLNADFLEVIYRMAAGALPTADDFLIGGDLGPLSIDSIGVKLSRDSIEWSLERLRRDPHLLDYISLAVPRGFMRPGALAGGRQAGLHAEPGAAALATFTVDLRGGFELHLPAGHAVESTLAGAGPLWLVGGDGHGGEQRIELMARGHGGAGFRWCARRRTARSRCGASRAAATCWWASASASRSGTGR
jgi:hypothetical protein